MMRKTMTRFFTVAEYEDVERYLREQHQNGWKLVYVKMPCFYVFESCEPQDVIYRMDYKNGEQTEEYMQMAQDFGWECFAESWGWLYFRKPVDVAQAEGEDELFSDNDSRLQMVEHIVRTRMLPILIVLLCCILPNLFQVINGKMGPFSGFFVKFFGSFFLFYVYILTRCGIKLKKIKADNQI